MNGQESEEVRMDAIGDAKRAINRSDETWADSRDAYDADVREAVAYATIAIAEQLKRIADALESANAKQDLAEDPETLMALK